MAKTTCDELITTPIPCLPMLMRVGEDGEVGSEAEPRKKGGVWEGILRLLLISHYWKIIN